MKPAGTVILLTVILLPFPSFCSETDWCAPDCDEAELVWDAALLLSLNHTESSKDSLVELCGAVRGNALVSLCKVLLEEWDVPSSDEQVRTPQLVFTPRVNLETVCPKDVPLKGAYTVMKLRVSASGTVDSAEVVHCPESCPELLTVAESTARGLRYRPPRGPQGYADFDVYWVLKAEVF
jgi:hypothetical protein